MGRLQVGGVRGNKNPKSAKADSGLVAAVSNRLFPSGPRYPSAARSISRPSSAER